MPFHLARKIGEENDRVVRAEMIRETLLDMDERGDHGELDYYLESPVIGAQVLDIIVEFFGELGGSTALMCAVIDSGRVKELDDIDLFEYIARSGNSMADKKALLAELQLRGDIGTVCWLLEYVPERDKALVYDFWKDIDDQSRIKLFDKHCYDMSKKNIDGEYLCDLEFLRKIKELWD